MAHFIKTTLGAETATTKWTQVLDNAASLWRAARDLDHQFQDAHPTHAELSRAAHEAFQENGPLPGLAANKDAASSK